MRTLDITNDNTLNFITNKNNKKTNLGGACTIILILIFLYSNYTILGNFIAHINPRLSFEILEIEKNSISNFKEKPFQFVYKMSINPLDLAFIDYSVDDINKVLYFNLTFDTYISDNDNLKRKSDSMPIKYCESNSLENYYGFDSVVNLNNYFCADIGDKKINGSYTNGSTVLSLKVQTCPINGVNPFTNENCANSTESAKFLEKGLTLDVYLPSYSIKKDNSTNGFYQRLNYQQVRIDLQAYKSFYLLFEESIMENDVGYLFDSPSTNTAYKINNILYDYIYTGNGHDPLKSKKIVEVFLGSSNTYTRILRNFVKFDDIISVLGGSFQFVYFIVVFVIQAYSENCFYLSMIDHGSTINFNSFRRFGRLNLINELDLRKLRDEFVNNENTNKADLVNNNKPNDEKNLNENCLSQENHIVPNYNKLKVKKSKRTDTINNDRLDSIRHKKNGRESKVQVKETNNQVNSENSININNKELNDKCDIDDFKSSNSNNILIKVNDIPIKLKNNSNNKLKTLKEQLNDKLTNDSNLLVLESNKKNLKKNNFNDYNDSLENADRRENRYKLINSLSQVNFNSEMSELNENRANKNLSNQEYINNYNDTKEGCIKLSPKENIQEKNTNNKKQLKFNEKNIVEDSIEDKISNQLIKKWNTTKEVEVKKISYEDESFRSISNGNISKILDSENQQNVNYNINISNKNNDINKTNKLTNNNLLLNGDKSKLKFYSSKSESIKIGCSFISSVKNNIVDEEGKKQLDEIPNKKSIINKNTIINSKRKSSKQPTYSDSESELVSKINLFK